MNAGCLTHGKVGFLLRDCTQYDWQRAYTFPTGRMVLNYKKLPYRTEWLKFNEVGEKVREL